MKVASESVTLVNEGSALLKLGNWAEAKKVLEKAVEMKEAVFGRDSIQLAITLTNLGLAFEIRQSEGCTLASCETE